VRLRVALGGFEFDPDLVEEIESGVLRELNEELVPVAVAWVFCQGGKADLLALFVMDSKLVDLLFNMPAHLLVGNRLEIVDLVELDVRHCSLLVDGQGCVNLDHVFHR